MAPDNYFEYSVRAQPHHTDSAGIVWHGSCIAWMEEARVECLRSICIEDAVVALGCELPVVELSLRYHRPIKLDMAAVVRMHIVEISSVRINWDDEIQSVNGQELYVTARTTLVAVDREKGKIIRIPPALKNALAQINGYT